MIPWKWRSVLDTREKPPYGAPYTILVCKIKIETMLDWIVVNAPSHIFSLTFSGAYALKGVSELPHMYYAYGIL